MARWRLSPRFARTEVHHPVEFFKEQKNSGKPVAVHTAIPLYESETSKGIASHIPLRRGLR
jgi:hypothetical protein